MLRCLRAALKIGMLHWFLLMLQLGSYVLLPTREELADNKAELQKWATRQMIYRNSTHTNNFACNLNDASRLKLLSCKYSCGG